MMDLIGAKFACAWELGNLDNRFCPYHYDLRNYVGLAVRVMRVCWRRLGGAQALTYVGGLVERAAVSSALVFVRGFRDLEEMGLCPICQEGFGFHGYCVCACCHIMHLDCRSSYEAHEHGRAPNQRPGCPVCWAEFDGFVCICV